MNKRTLLSKWYSLICSHILWISALSGYAPSILIPKVYFVFSIMKVIIIYQVS